MVTRSEMQELVESHAQLEDPMDTAIWLRQSDSEAWLLEVIPAMGSDEHPERPVSFSAGRSFRHALNLIAGNPEDIRLAIQTNAELAQWVLDGEILHGSAAGLQLQDFARSALSGQSAAG
jgi:hypothetical protein